MTKWILAPTSGIWHAVGILHPRKEIKPGTQVLCGWVIQKNDVQVDAPPDGARLCQTCRFATKEKK